MRRAATRTRSRACCATPTARASSAWCCIRAWASPRRRFATCASAAEFSALYNGFIADWCKRSGGRLFGVAVVPIEDVQTSIRMLAEAKQQGLVCTLVPPALRERNLDHPDLEPFWAAAADLDMPLGVHGAPGIHLPKIGVDRFTNYIQVHCVSFPFDQMTAMTSLVSGGVFDRHPRLRVAFLEAGVTWVPYFIDRLHEHWEKRGSWIPNGWQRDPREYIARGQIYVSCEPDETVLPAVLDALGSGFRHVRERLPALGRRVPEQHARAAHAHGSERGVAAQGARGERAALLRLPAWAVYTWLRSISSLGWGRGRPAQDT